MSQSSSSPSKPAASEPAGASGAVANRSVDDADADEPAQVPDRSVYRRVLLKLSGEALVGDAGYGIDPKVLDKLAAEIAEASRMDVELGIVVGGGNIFRGLSGASRGMDRATADYVGMLATVMNSVALCDALEKRGVVTRVLTAIEMSQLAEPYIRRRAIRHLEKGRVCIFAAGTGNPFFTTDTAAALRAVEIGAEVLIKATKVDGVYNKDPNAHADARLYHRVAFTEALKNDLRVMDASAFALCRENSLPIVVFNVNQSGNICHVLRGADVGTMIVGDTEQTRFAEESRG